MFKDKRERARKNMSATLSSSVPRTKSTPLTNQQTLFPGAYAYPTTLLQTSRSPSALQAAARANGLVLGAIDAKARALNGVSVRVERDGRPEPSHPALVLLRMNPKTTLYDWLRMYVEARDIYGVLYMYLELDSSGTPRAWRIIDNTCLDYVAGAWYERNPNGQRVRLEEQALLAFSRTSLVQTGGALSACLESVLLDNTITEKFAAWFKNAPLISSALSVPGIVSDRIAEQIRSTWVANYSGAGSLAVLGNGSSYQQYVPAFRDLDIASIRGATESRITTSFGVPPLVLYAAYALERATYSNLEQAFKAFYVNTVLPLAREIEHELTYTLLPLYESPDDLASERVRFVLDMSAVTILQLLQLAAPQVAEDATEQAAQSEARAHVHAHAIKQAEVFSPEYVALEERFTKAMQRYVSDVMDDLEAEARLGAGNV